MIGQVKIYPQDLSLLPIDVAGLTLFEGYISEPESATDSIAKEGGNVVTGKIQLTCRLEAHIEPDDSEPDSSDDLMFEFDSKNSLLGAAKRIIPRVSEASVIAIALEGLVPMHKLSTNSPKVVISCGEWHAQTHVSKISDSFFLKEKVGGGALITY